MSLLQLSTHFFLLTINLLCVEGHSFSCVQKYSFGVLKEKERESLEYDVFSRFMEKVSTEFNYAYNNNDYIFHNNSLFELVHLL